VSTIKSKYWEQEGANKIFTHELSAGWIENVPLDSWVLDLGCGYGRVTKQLYETGYTKIIGYDPSRSMISRAVKENAGPTYTFRKDDILNQKYSLVVCFALFASCPEPENQMELKNIIEKQTARRAYLYSII
jgi:SAM-dependent methyltransferase